MNKFALRAIALAVLALAQPVFANEIDDLKAEIAAQKAAEAAQKARLDALEAKLDAAAASQQATAPAPKAAKSGFDGLAYTSPTFDIKLYGLIDATIGVIDHATSAGGHKIGFDATATNAPWFSGARWGITGARKFADEGLSAIFKLENEYLIKDGSADDSEAAFGRDAWVGFQSEGLGKLTFGRQNTLARDFALTYLDPYGSSAVSYEEGGGTNGNNFKQLIFYAGSATGTRYDNGVVWKKDFGGGLFAGAGFQFGEVPADKKRNTTESLAAGYNGGVFNVSGFVTHSDVEGLSHNAFSIGGNYQVSIVRINAGYFHYTADNPSGLPSRSDNAYTISAKIAPPGKIDYELGYQIMKTEDAGVNGSGSVLNAFKDTSSVAAVASGNRNTVYGSVFYHFDKSTEVYLAADHQTLTGNYMVATAHGFKDQNEVGVGVRLRF